MTCIPCPAAAGRPGRDDGGDGRYDAGACADRWAGCPDHDQDRHRGRHRDERHQGHHRDEGCSHLGDRQDECLNQAADAPTLAAAE